MMPPRTMLIARPRHAALRRRFLDDICLIDADDAAILHAPCVDFALLQMRRAEAAKHQEAPTRMPMHDDEKSNKEDRQRLFTFLMLQPDEH